MTERNRNIKNHDQGYSLIEMLIVTALIIILATVPVALLRRSRDNICEAEALRALRMMALAYENYYAQNGHIYPNYRTDGTMANDVEYASAEEIWDTITRENLVPGMYSGYPHDRPDLLARGYTLSIVPSDHGSAPGQGASNQYAIAMIPYEGGIAHRGIAVVRGQKFFSNYPSVVPRKMGDLGLYDLSIYSWGD